MNGDPYAVAGYRLRKPELGDIDAFLVQKNDPEVVALLGGGGTAYTREGLERWVEFHRDAHDEAFFVVADAANHPAGHIALYKIDRVAGHAEFGIMLGDKATWGQGLGTACTRWIIEYGFRELGLRRIYLEVLATNPRARRVYEKLGFRDEGRLREHRMRDGKPVDLLIMGLLREEYVPG
jgi:RimJ/RimL family protein N-acetyltransferase